VDSSARGDELIAETMAMSITSSNERFISECLSNSYGDS
jgi:hypothetical protein